MLAQLDRSGMKPHHPKAKQRFVVQDGERKIPRLSLFSGEQSPTRFSSGKMKSYPVRTEKYCGEFPGSAIILPLLADFRIAHLLIRRIPLNHDVTYRLDSNGFEWDITQNESQRSAEWCNPRNGMQQEDKE
jgi:hypothetical protein